MKKYFCFVSRNSNVIQSVRINGIWVFPDMTEYNHVDHYKILEGCTIQEVCPDELPKPFQNLILLESLP